MSTNSSGPLQAGVEKHAGDADSSADAENGFVGDEAQRRFWNEWNAQYRGEGMRLPPPNQRQAETILHWLEEAGRGPLDIVEVGCGSGWLCAQLRRFGKVRGIDIADQALDAARSRWPDVTFIAGDFTAMQLEPAKADVVVTLEALSHVADQQLFIGQIASLLREGGLLMLATQNRFVLERMDGVAPPGPGQIRKWVDSRQLRSLLESCFEILQLTSLHPTGHVGVLRWVNSAKLHALLGYFGLGEAWTRAKERWLLGHTLVVLARKRRKT